MTGYDQLSKYDVARHIIEVFISTESKERCEIAFQKYVHWCGDKRTSDVTNTYLIRPSNALYIADILNRPVYCEVS